ncbi:hypothetical protein HA151_06455 [Prochlorococcus marinus XMU1419]|uniref:hypothetical protein n=1 Tax=Prochlorococcus marinus TaxID=1219 RepID=UPI001ADACAB3|nr:hypothetical protein [Prochlorococcus marinus]MBO8234155.1 hypothetical protein [Prochlorococcus marinus XMU1419]
MLVAYSTVTLFVVASVSETVKARFPSLSETTTSFIDIPGIIGVFTGSLGR